MYKLSISLAVVVSIFSALSSATRAVEPKRENIEWANIWVVDADKTDLPRVLMIGDSITMGYFDGVANSLQGKASCARLATSKCICDPAFLPEVEMLLKNYSFAVIHFNNGLHGFDYDNKQYADAFNDLLKTFKKHAPQAKLIWASSTPERDPRDLSKFSETNRIVTERNSLADRFMKENQIPVDDLYGLVADHPEFQGGDGVHFNEKGRDAQAKQVYETILRQLPQKSPGEK